MQSHVVELRIPKRRLAFFKFVLEGFGHLALPVVLSAEEGRVRVLVSPQEVSRWEALWRDLEPWLRG